MPFTILTIDLANTVHPALEFPRGPAPPNLLTSKAVLALPYQTQLAALTGTGTTPKSLPLLRASPCTSAHPQLSRSSVTARHIRGLPNTSTPAIIIATPCNQKGWGQAWLPRYLQQSNPHLTQKQAREKSHPLACQQELQPNNNKREHS